MGTPPCHPLAGDNISLLSAVSDAPTPSTPFRERTIIDSSARKATSPILDTHPIWVPC